MKPSLGTDRHPDYLTARSKGLIEKGILDIADTLYANGCFPLSSCEGHIDAFSWFDRLIMFNLKYQPQFRPFVMFTCSIELGKDISSIINEANSKYCWFMYSYLNPIFKDLVWLIELKDSRMFNSKIDKKDVREDLTKLGSIIT